MSKWTPEPWTILPGNVILGADGVPVVCTTVYLRENPGTVKHSPEEIAATRDRIVSCVNACTGLNPAAIPALVEAAQRVIDLQFVELTNDENMTQEQFDEALAKDAAEQDKAMAELAAQLAAVKGTQ